VPVEIAAEYAMGFQDNLMGETFRPLLERAVERMGGMAYRAEKIVLDEDSLLPAILVIPIP
jgi:hypothetical protein